MESSPKELLTYRLLKLVRENRDLTQREMASRTGVSLGKLNSCMLELIEKSQIRKTFASPLDKKKCSYEIAPEGAEELCRLAARLLEAKKAEFEEVRREIVCLSRGLEAEDFISANPVEAEAGEEN